VDDVLTTGASLQALAEAVRATGAAEVHAVVMARAMS
jgi:predicted amidophosphoribosyltransferase